MRALILLMILNPILTWATYDFEGYELEKKLDWETLNLKSEETLKLALESPSKDSTFTIREFDKLETKSLKKNVKTWLSDYRSYGFVISNSKPIKYGSNTYGYLIEAIHKSSGKIFKQYMSIRDGRLVTLTCHSNRIDDEFKDCGTSLSSFRWSN